MSHHFEKSDMSLVADLGRVNLLCRKAITKAVAPLGFTEPRWRVMMNIRTLGEGCTQLQLAESLNIAMPSLTRTIKQVEQCGLVERRVDTQDQRSRHLYFTAQGYARVAELTQCINAIKADIYADIGEQDLCALANTVAILSRNAQNYLEG